MAKHKCTACKIGSMKKKKHRVSGLGKADTGEVIALVIGAPVGALIAQEGKAYAMPMLTEGKTADEVITTSRIANGVLGLTGLGIAVGGYMYRKKSPMVGTGLISLGLGIATQVALSVYVNDIKDQTLSPKLSGKGWDAKAWNAERNKRLGLRGADNQYAGLAGADNESSGLAGKLRTPLMTEIDQVGSHFRMSGCGV